MARLDRERVIESFMMRNPTAHWNSGRTMRSLRTENGDFLLFSYNAIIAHQPPGGGRITLFNGWRGHSATTSTHMGIMDRILPESRIRESDAKPRASLMNGIETDGSPVLDHLHGVKGYHEHRRHTGLTCVYTWAT